MIAQSVLNVMVEQTEGALLRVLGTVERRGFHILQVQTHVVSTSVWQVILTVSGERPVDVLCRQLERLVDVYSAALATRADSDLRVANV